MGRVYIPERRTNHGTNHSEQVSCLLLLNTVLYPFRVVRPSYKLNCIAIGWIRIEEGLCWVVRGFKMLSHGWVDNCGPSQIRYFGYVFYFNELKELATLGYL